MTSQTRIRIPAPSLLMTLSPSDWKSMPPHIRITVFLALSLTACHTVSAASQQPKPRDVAVPAAPATIPTTSTTAPAPPATTIPVPVAAAVHPNTQVPADIAALVHLHFDEFGTDTAEWFLGIVWRESNGQPDAWNRASGCYGLSQLALPVHAARFAARGWDWQTTWMDADKNLTIASDIYRDSGKGPWSL